MELVNRDRTPALFAVGTSVTSGLIVAVVVGAFRGDLVPGPLLLLVFGVVAVLVLLGSAAYLRVRGPARVFLMTSAFSQKYFLAALVQRVHGTLDGRGIDMVLKVPQRDYNAHAQSLHLTRLSGRRREYCGGIVVVTEARRLREDLVEFCRKSRLPVVFTDIEPFEKESEYPAKTAFVGYETGALGELAGKWLVEHLRGRDQPHVLIIASHEHEARQERCAEALRAGLADVDITTRDNCAFNRSLAHRAVLTHVQRLGQGERLDAIFCTNDEMALGAVDALTPRTPATADTVVVGIDGVREARTLIDSGDSPLRATVVQDTKLLSFTIVDILDKMRGGREVPKRTYLTAEIHEATGNGRP